MSGGSMDYLYSKVEDADFEENTALRKVFRLYLNKVAKALHDIEWVDSCDYSRGMEDEAILEVIEFEPTLSVIQLLHGQRKEIEQLITKLEEKR